MQASSSNGVSSTPPRRFGVQRIAQICRLPQGLGEQRQQCRGSSTHSGERTWRRAPPAFTGSRRAACGLTAGGARQGSRLAAGGARQGSRPTPGGGRCGLHGRPAHRRWARRRWGARRKAPSKDGGSGRPPNSTPPPQQRGESGKGRKANPRRRRRFGVPRRGPRQGKAMRTDTARRRRGPPRRCARHESGRNPRSALRYDTCRYRNIRLFSGLPLHAV